MCIYYIWNNIGYVEFVPKITLVEARFIKKSKGVSETFR